MEYLKNSRKNEIIINSIQQNKDEQLPVVQNKSIFRKILGKVQRTFKNIFSSDNVSRQLTDEEVRPIKIKEDKLEYVKGFNISEEIAIQKTINNKTQPLQDRNQDNGER